jgi:uncharacterized protein
MPCSPDWQATLDMQRYGLCILAVALPVSVSAQPAPIIDMHLHALGANDQGPPPVAVCAPFPSFPAWDQRQGYVDSFVAMLKNPACDEPIWSPASDDELREETIEVLETLNIFGVLSGPTRRVQAWREAAPGRFIAGLGFSLGLSAPSPDSIRALVENGSLEVLAEVTNQYFGVEPADEAMAPYWALAEELDLPVGIHMGPGPPGGIYIGQTDYRARLSSALLLEDVLVRHPRLRVYVMHAGYPLLDDMLALLYAHPQVHVEVGVVVFSRPREDFYRYLRAMVEAGFEDRIMFGSDQMVWPGAIEHAVRVIETAPFLTDRQKRAILYDNAARFLRLSDEEIDRHWGRPGS